MKIAVYTIALNEEKHVKRWYESAKDADYLLIADTGSSDNTIKIAKKLGINIIKISVKPWRFDDARNAALAALPDDIDYCVSMDMDETLSEGWREKLEDMKADRITYLFNLSFRDIDETVPESQMINNRIHKRHGFRWKYLMHEVIIPSRTKNFTEEFCKGLEVSHHPDPDKPRDQYNQMVEDAYDEYKTTRYASYHGLQLYSFERFKEAKKLFKEIIKNKKSTKEERSQAYRFLSYCVKRNKTWYLYRSLAIAKSREAYAQLAVNSYNNDNWIRCYFYAKKADSIRKKTAGIFTTEIFWGWMPYNLISISKYNMKLFKYSKKYKSQKKTLKINSIITHNFKIFED
jgi:glycosyltransferase involved in cell wall biosynthesis